MKKSNFLSILFLCVVLIVTVMACKKNFGVDNTNNLTISGNAFSSTSHTVAKGTEVVWTNNDAVSHTVTSDDGTSFDSGTIVPGDHYRYTFNTAGTFAYHCKIHGSMTATVTVNP